MAMWLWFLLGFVVLAIGFGIDGRNSSFDSDRGQASFAGMLFSGIGAAFTVVMKIGAIGFSYIKEWFPYFIQWFGWG